jgi:opacity protein-like surface antigen
MSGHSARRSTAVGRLLPGSRALALAGLLLPLLLLLPAPALAELPLEITPWAGWVSGGSFLDGATGDVLRVGDSAGFGLVLGLRDTPLSGYELLYGFQRTELGGYDAAGRSGPTGLDVHYLHVGGIREFEGERVRPFVAGGLGLTALVPGGDGQGSGTNFSLSLGGGVKIPLSGQATLRLEGRGYLTFMQSGTGVFCAVSSGGGGCAVEVEGDTFGQIAVLAGISFAP